MFCVATTHHKKSMGLGKFTESFHHYIPSYFSFCISLCTDFRGVENHLDFPLEEGQS